MSLKLRLLVMNFLQFFIWGAWLLTIGAYWFQGRLWSGAGFGAIFSTMGIASLFMPSIAGIVAVIGSSLSGHAIDRWFSEPDGSKDWQGIWLAFALCSLAMSVLFVLLFKYRHAPAVLRTQDRAVDA